MAQQTQFDSRRAPVPLAGLSYLSLLDEVALPITLLREHRSTGIPRSEIILTGVTVSPTHLKRAFNATEAARATALLADLVSRMSGRKLEEADWSGVYTSAKGIPEQGWSNLGIDVMHNGLGVEHKMLCTGAASPLDSLGSTKMHPAATRSIRIDSVEADASDVMVEVIEQYGELLQQRREKLAEGGKPDLRTGWLLWKRDLTEFLYFEEELVAPATDSLEAVWHSHAARGQRKATKNLWIYEKGTTKKRFSVTTQAGIKIQPYFEVPAQLGESVYHFDMRAQKSSNGNVKVWATEKTLKGIEKLVGSHEAGSVSSAIQQAFSAPVSGPAEIDVDRVAHQIEISASAYETLESATPEVIDDLRLKIFLDLLEAHQT